MQLICRKYLTSESEVTASIPVRSCSPHLLWVLVPRSPILLNEYLITASWVQDTIRNVNLSTAQHGPWTNDMFSQASDYIKETLTRVVLPGFFKSPAGLAYSRVAISKEHDSRRQSMEDAIIPVSVSIVDVVKRYEKNEKYYQYKIDVESDTMQFTIWRR